MFGWLSELKARRKEARRREKFERAQAWSQGLSVQETFERIYAEGKWGKGPDAERFWSGNGSRAGFTERYEAFVVDFLERHPELASVVDVGCGDFQVSGRILARLSRPIDYTGLDIVRPLIEQHQQRHARANVRFQVCNVAEEELPGGDVVLIRQILQHLSNAQVARVLAEARQRFRVAIITESIPTRLVAPNLDIGYGIATRIALGSGVMIDRPPYGLTVAESFDTPHSDDESVRTSVVWLGPAPAR